jgi:adenosine/AMP kinase
MDFLLIPVEVPSDVNFILGQTHFIKTVEDVYEVMVNSVPQAKFGIAFNEASGPCLVRHDGNDEELRKLAVKTMQAVGAGHTFCIFMRNAYPVNVLPSVKDCREVCCVYCATANPVQVIVAQGASGRGVVGVIDGSSPKGVETEEQIRERLGFLRKIGYKRG